jgi:hypothetical protein
MKWPIRTRAPFLLNLFHAGTRTAAKLAIEFGDHGIEPNPIEPVCGYWSVMG